MIHWLASTLAMLPQLAATELACTWALSHRDDERLAVAQALTWRFPLVGDDIVLEHLRRDAVSSVRDAARAATRIRTATRLARLPSLPGART